MQKFKQVVESNAAKEAADFMKVIQKHIQRSIKELESDSFGGVGSVTPGLVGKMLSLQDQKWYRDLFK